MFYILSFSIIVSKDIQLQVGASNYKINTYILKGDGSYRRVKETLAAEISAGTCQKFTTKKQVDPCKSNFWQVNIQGSLYNGAESNGWIFKDKNCVSFKFSKLPVIDPTGLKPLLSLSPSKMPTSFPTTKPSPSPSKMPTSFPTTKPSLRPSKMPTSFPTTKSSLSPTRNPTMKPSKKPSKIPTKTPSMRPSPTPSNSVGRGKGKQY